MSVKQSEQNTSEELSWFSSEIFTNTTQNGKDNETQSHNYETVGLLVKVFKKLPQIKNAKLTRSKTCMYSKNMFLSGKKDKLEYLDHPPPPHPVFSFLVSLPLGAWNLCVQLLSLGSFREVFEALKILFIALLLN